MGNCRCYRKAKAINNVLEMCVIKFYNIGERETYFLADALLM